MPVATEPRVATRRTERAATRRTERVAAPVRSEGTMPGVSRASTKIYSAETDRVTNVLEYPYSAVGKVLARKGNSTWHGSGWIVGRRAIVTAGHVVNKRSDALPESQWQFYDNLFFAPEYTPQSTGPEFRLVECRIHRNFVDPRVRDHLRWDIAVAYVEEDLIRDYGSLGYDASGAIEDGEPVESVGYPLKSRPLNPAENGGQHDFENHDFDGNQMWYSFGECLWTASDFHHMSNEMTPGCSGGPWLANETVAVGLNSHGNAVHNNSNYSPIFDDDFLALINWLIEKDAF